MCDACNKRRRLVPTCTHQPKPNHFLFILFFIRKIKIQTRERFSHKTLGEEEEEEEEKGLHSEFNTLLGAREVVSSDIWRRWLCPFLPPPLKRRRICPRRLRLSSPLLSRLLPLSLTPETLSSLLL